MDTLENLRSKSTEKILPRVIGTGGSAIVTLFSTWDSDGCDCSGHGTESGSGHGTPDACPKGWFSTLGADFMAVLTDRAGAGGVDCDSGFGTAPEVSSSGAVRSSDTAIFEHLVFETWRPTLAFIKEAFFALLPMGLLRVLEGDGAFFCGETEFNSGGTCGVGRPSPWSSSTLTFGAMGCCTDLCLPWVGTPAVGVEEIVCNDGTTTGNGSRLSRGTAASPRGMECLPPESPTASPSGVTKLRRPLVMVALGIPDVTILGGFFISISMVFSPSHGLPGRGLFLKP